MKSSFEHIRVVDIKVHPLYDDFSLGNDFAVLYLERDSEASVITLDDGESFDYHTGANMTTIVSNTLPFSIIKKDSPQVLSRDSAKPTIIMGGFLEKQTLNTFPMIYVKRCFRMLIHC